MAPLHIVYLGIFDDALQPTWVYTNFGWNPFLWLQDIKDAIRMALRTFPKETVNIIRGEMYGWSTGARGYAISIDNICGALVFMGDEDASVEYLKACLILRGLATCCQSSSKILDETALRMRMQQLVAESSVQEQLQRVKEELAEWEIVEHSAQSIQERYYGLVRIHEWHKELQAALEKRRNFVRNVDVELSSALKDLQEGLHRPQLKAKICNTLEQTKSSTNELNELNTVLEDSRKSLKDRREKFRSLDTMSKDLHQVHTALSQDLEIANPAPIREEVEQFKVASEEAHRSRQGIQRELDDTMIIVQNTIEALKRRGESIEELTHKSYRLSEASRGFKTQAKKSNSCCPIM